jgi:hypothetical protein
MTTEQTEGPTKKEGNSTWIGRHYFALSVASRTVGIAVAGTLTMIALIIAVNVFVTEKSIPKDWPLWLSAASVLAITVVGYFLIGWMFALLLMDTRRDLLMSYRFKKMRSSIKNILQGVKNTSSLTYNMEQLNLLMLSHARRYSGSNRYEELFRSDVLKKIDLGFRLIAEALRQKLSFTETPVEPFPVAVIRPSDVITSQEFLDYKELDDWTKRLHELILGHRGGPPRGRSMNVLAGFFDKTTIHIRGYLGESTFNEISKANDARYESRIRATQGMRTFMKDIALVLLGALLAGVFSRIL